MYQYLLPNPKSRSYGLRVAFKKRIYNSNGGIEAVQVKN
jgi:hypothetical protein